jgi:hypothetical protein
VKKNPWTCENGAVAITDEDGTGENDFNITNGYQLKNNRNRVVVIYDGHRIKFGKDTEDYCMRYAEEGVAVNTISFLFLT